MRDLEAIASAPYRLQVTRILRIGFDFFADAANINVDGARGDICRVTPDRIEQLVAGKNAPGMPHEVIEQAEFGSRGWDLFAAHGKRHGGGINVNLVDLGGQGRQGTLETAQDGLYAGHKFARAEGLGDVVIGAEFQSQNAIGLATLGGEKDYWDRCQRDRL